MRGNRFKKFHFVQRHSESQSGAGDYDPGLLPSLGTYVGLQTKLRNKSHFEGKKNNIDSQLDLPELMRKLTRKERRRHLWVEGEKGRFWTH